MPAVPTGAISDGDQWPLLGDMDPAVQDAVGPDNRRRYRIPVAAPGETMARVASGSN
jgi:hypothetical protein